MIKRTPALRFKGFVDEWEEKELYTEVEFFNGLTYSPNDVTDEQGTLVLRSSNVKNNEIVTDDNVYVNHCAVNCQNVKKGDIAVVVRNGSKSLIGKHAQIKQNMRQTVIGAFMTGIRSSQPEFTTAILDTQNFNDEIEKNLGATINQITNSAFKSMIFKFPKNPEQTKIGSFFKTLDTRIAQQQKKHDALVNVKKALLQKMFPQNGKTLPEVRFKGFEGEWEEKTLGEVADNIGDGLHGTPVYSNTGNVFFINGNNLKDGNVIIDDSTCRVNECEQSEKDKKLNLHSLLMSINGTIGNLALYNNENIMLGKSVAFITVKNIDRVFLFYLLQTKYIQNYFYDNLTGSTIKNLGLSTIRKTSFSEPVKAEQTKIGELFKTVGNLIDLNNQKLEKLKDIKKACLEKMFV